MLRNKQVNSGLIDYVTGVSNRRYFDERLPKEISYSQRYQKSLSCLFIGIDCFAQYKKSYGYINSDKILKQVAQKIWSGLRTTDIIGRYSEEKIAVLLIEADIDRARSVAERIQQNIQSQQIELEGDAIQITVSIGISDARQSDPTDHCNKSSGELMLAAAERALQYAKETGKNQVRCSPPTSLRAG